MFVSRYLFLPMAFVAGLLPAMLYGGKLSLSLFYSPMSVSREEVMPENPINDNYHRIFVTVPERLTEPEAYYLVIEGADLGEQPQETVVLAGFSSSRTYILTKVNGVLLFENKEKIPRRFAVVVEGESSPQNLAVPPLSTAKYPFMRTGNYTFIDADNPSAKVFVRALVGCGLYPVKGSLLKVDIPTLPPGTYSIKIFYAFRQIFQEDFSMVGDSALAVNYRITNREVLRDDSTTVTSGRIVSGPVGHQRGRSEAAAPESGASRNQP